MAEMNPRVLRDQYGKYVGKKVTIGTQGLHYVSGIVQAIQGKDLHITVSGKLVIVPADVITSIQEAPASQAEYVK
jgi:ribosome maturation factor RimP